MKRLLIFSDGIESSRKYTTIISITSVLLAGKDLDWMIIAGYADKFQLKELNEGGCERTQLEGG
jgi:hypothetical protein